jgi:hypothetical protein
MVDSPNPHPVYRHQETRPPLTGNTVAVT